MENKVSDPPAVLSGMRSDNPPHYSSSSAAATKKDRRIVSWSPEEDDLLREQVAVNGENWTSIAAKFKDKTSRQCRRRWYTYLNSEGKKGGWSAEEDRILCEAQKIFGNRWTEITKVVSGRTDNAVKNRFSTLCKKKAKHDASSKENDGPYVNPNNKRATSENCSTDVGITNLAAPVKHIRYQTSDFTVTQDPDEKSHRRCTMGESKLRPPLSVLPENFSNMGGVSTQYHVDAESKATLYTVSNSKTEGNFLSRNDPKLTALLQQAELLSSLALKVNSENTNQSLENAWKELQDYLVQTGAHEMLTRTPEMDILFDDFKDLIESLKSSSTGGELSQSGQHDIDELSHGSSEYSTGSIRQSQVHVNDQTEDNSLYRNATVNCLQEGECSVVNKSQEKALPLPKESMVMNENITIPSSKFDSPLQMVPTFQTLAEGIPTPNFSTSMKKVNCGNVRQFGLPCDACDIAGILCKERKFLRSVLDMSSPIPSPSSCTLPSCKRVLLDSL